MKVIVTGASKGIGRGIAAFLARDGFQIGALARSQYELQELKSMIEEIGEKCSIAVCNVRDHESVKQAIPTLVNEMEGVDALINNAGLVIRKDVFKISLDEWHAMIETNINGVFYVTRAVLPYFKEQESGHIITISSVSGHFPLPGGSGYAASKYAVTGFSASMLQEVRQYGIKVTTMFPGSVNNRAPRDESEEDASWKIQPEEIGQACRDVLHTSPQNCISELEIRPLRPPKK